MPRWRGRSPRDAGRWLTGGIGVPLAGHLLAHFSRGGGINADIVDWTPLALLFLLVHHAFERMALVRRAAGRHLRDILGDTLITLPASGPVFATSLLPAGAGA